MRCIISSLDRTLEYADVSSVSFPASDGEVEALPGHAEAYFLVSGGVIRVAANDGMRTVRTGSGECRIADDAVHIVVDDISA